MVRWVKSLKWLALGFMAASVSAGAQEQLTEGGFPSAQATAGGRIGRQDRSNRVLQLRLPALQRTSRNTSDRGSRRCPLMSASSAYRSPSAGLGEPWQDLLHTRRPRPRRSVDQGFSSLHGAGVKLNEEKVFFDWAASNGLDAKKVQGNVGLVRGQQQNESRQDSCRQLSGGQRADAVHRRQIQAATAPAQGQHKDVPCRAGLPDCQGAYRAQQEVTPPHAPQGRRVTPAAFVFGAGRPDFAFRARPHVGRMTHLPDAIGLRHTRFHSPARLRIACLVPSITETLFALGLGDRVVARTGFCIHPADGVREVPKVGGTKDVNVAKLIATEPTHVIVNIDENRKDTVDHLRRVIPNVVVTHPLVPEDNQAVRLARAYLQRRRRRAGPSPAISPPRWLMRATSAPRPRPKPCST